MKLTDTHKEALRTIKDGADIRSRELAKTLREIEAAQPEFISIGKEQGEYGVDEKLPYFGAIATRKGLEWAKEKG
jgi:hypothetical protein